MKNNFILDSFMRLVHKNMIYSNLSRVNFILSLFDLPILPAFNICFLSFHSILYKTNHIPTNKEMLAKHWNYDVITNSRDTSRQLFKVIRHFAEEKSSNWSIDLFGVNRSTKTTIVLSCDEYWQLPYRHNF